MDLIALHTELIDAYKPCDCGCVADELPNLVADDVIQALIMKVFNAQGLYTQSAEMTTAIFNDLWKGVLKGLDTEGDYSEDAAFIEALKTNVSQFSAAKDKTMLRELNRALVNDQGALLSFEEFKAIAQKITGEYLRTYLKTEYNLAITGAQMAAKWKTILANADTLPLLQFDAVLDKRTTEICRPLDGVILPIDHVFWKRYTPPNHYLCRSTIRQLASGKVTEDTKIPSIEIPRMFQTNLGEAQLIFPPDHPYFL